MRLATVAESREIDARARSERGLSGESLMEAAGALAAREIREFITTANLTRSLLTKAFIGIVCGPGGNGADGLVVARHLASVGFHVRVYLTEAAPAHELLRLNLGRLPKSVVRSSVTAADELVAGVFVSKKYHRPALIVDALLGLGTSREVGGALATFIDALNLSDAPVISLDLPSGLDADSGQCLGTAVVAKLTLTFGLAKRGFFVNAGPRHVGRLRILPIGLPYDLVGEVACTQTAFTAKSAKRVLPRRLSTSNKASNGRVAVFAGQPKMIGAALLAGQAATRVGTGYVTLVTHHSSKDAKARAEVAQVAPEFLTLAYDDPKLWQKVASDVAIVGPGFGVGADVLAVLHSLSRQCSDTVIVDADALTTLAEEKAAGRQLPLRKSWILTPHAGELARLIGGEAKDVEAKRFESVQRAAKELGTLVLLKGFRTVVSDGEKCCVILSGNAGLAKAGSGDTLAGMIGGFLAQKVLPFEAACLGAYVHGRMADDWLKAGRDILSLQPTDLASALPTLLKQIRASSRALK